MSESRSELSLCCARTILPLPPEPPPWKLCQARLSPSARASRPVGQEYDQDDHARAAHRPRRRARRPSGICTCPAARAPLTGARRPWPESSGPAASFGGSQWQHFVTRRSLNGTVSTFRRIARKWHGDARRPDSSEGCCNPATRAIPVLLPLPTHFGRVHSSFPPSSGAEMESSGGGREGRPGPGGRGEGWRQGDERVVLAGKDTLALTAFTVIHSRRCRNLPGRDASSRPDGNTVWSGRPRANEKYLS